jgi:magnesium transporter
MDELHHRPDHLHDDELNDLLSLTAQERAEAFRELPADARATMLLRSPEAVRREILHGTSDVEIVAALEFLDPDEATDMVQLLPARRRSRIVVRLNKTLREGVEFLVGFDAETAAGVMTVDYIQVNEQDSIAEVARQFQIHEDRTGRLPVIISVRNGHPSGQVPVHALALGRPESGIRRRIQPISTIPYDADIEAVRKIFREHRHDKAAVVGRNGNVIGIIYADDMLRLLDEHRSASLYDFAGVHDEEAVTDPIASKVRHRYKWLMVNLATAFLASAVVGLFEDVIAKEVILAAYMPIVAGMGGNAATQTLAVMVRGIALDQITLATAGRTVAREMLAGLTNGGINGVLVAGVVFLTTGNLAVALILSAAMIVNLVVAGAFGTMVPLIMHRLGKDPASSATVFITTATDVLGFLTFLGLAAMFLL